MVKTVEQIIINYLGVVRVPALLLLMLPAAVVVKANEYSFDYSVKGGYEYNDNVGLRAEDEVDVSGGKISLPATLTVRSERLAASLMGEVLSTKYDDSDYDSDDQNLQGKVGYELERGNVSGHAGLDRTSTRDTELLDTGDVGLSATRVEIATAGSAGEYMFSEKSGVVAGLDYRETDYASPRYVNFDYTTGYAGVTHQWTERTRLRLQGYGNRYENSSAIQVTSDSVGVQAGFDTTLSTQLQASLLAGWINTDTEYSTDLPIPLPDDDDSNGYLLNASLDYSQERYSLAANISRNLTPSGNGVLRETDQLTVKYRYEVSERSQAKLDLLVGTISSLNSQFDDDRDYAQARLGLDYRFARSWYIAGSYTYLYQDRKIYNDDADSNQIDLSLIYRPDRKVWSR